MFTTVDEVKQAIRETCESIVTAPVQSVGYVEPGHGAKGKQRWLLTDANVAEINVQSLQR